MVLRIAGQNLWPRLRQAMGGPRAAACDYCGNVDLDRVTARLEARRLREAFTALPAIMSGEKIEGTIVLDGLVQGRLPLGDDQIPQQLKQWVQFISGMGVRFNLEVRDAAFNLLPDNRATSAKPLGDPPEHALEQGLTQLADLFSGPERSQLFSTLRSSEFRPGEEVQTVYTIV